VILNRQRRVRARLPELEKFLARVLEKVRLRSDALTVCLISDAEMKRWNHAYRGKNRPTDVLSFPANESSWKRKQRAKGVVRAGSYLGDIAIAPGVARKNARRLGHEFDDELRILILHGVLHLMGYDHETDKGEMDRRERRLRGELGLA
jgi:probable rRNA maturation factor